MHTGLQLPRCRGAAVYFVPPPHPVQANLHPLRNRRQAKRRAFDLATIRRFMGADVISLLSVPVFITEPVRVLCVLRALRVLHLFVCVVLVGVMGPSTCRMLLQAAPTRLPPPTTVAPLLV